MSRLLPVFLAVFVLGIVLTLPLAHISQKHRTYRNFRIVEDGVLYRSGQMTPAGFERVCLERGIRTVIKLREARDEKPDDIAADQAEEAFCRTHGIVLHRVLPKDWEIGDPPEAVQNLRWFERVMDDPIQTPRPVLIHCFAGIHRTGAIVAAYRMKYGGWTNEQAVTELLSCGRFRTTFDGNQIPYLLTKYQPARSRE
jgi:protein tyrosine/serine phosphatase